MAQSVLMVYEPLDLMPDAGYWREYINFYEKFWDRPASPKSTWWGAEYDEFRKSLSNRLDIKTGEIRDCFFTKKDGKYCVCRIRDDSSFNIVSSDNLIPFEWFLAFDETKRNFFYTHAGFGAVHHDSIYYVEAVGTAMKNLSSAGEILGTIEETVSKYPEFGKLKNVCGKNTGNERLAARI